MIQVEFIDIKGRLGTKTFSDKNVYIVDNNNISYFIAYDLLNNQKEYFETDIQIEE